MLCATRLGGGMETTMDALALARRQFGVTTVYHFFFVPLTLGLSILVALVETMYVRTGDETYKRMTKFWGKLFLINRGVAMEFRSKAPGASWRAGWDWAIFAGSLIPALIFGVAVGNLLRGVPIDETKTYTGTFLGLLNPYSVVAGLTFVLLFLLHGACFLRLRVDGPVLNRVDAAVKRLWSLTVLVAVCLLAFSWKQTGLFKGGAIAFILPGLAALALVGAGLVKKPGAAFGLTAATILLLTVSAFRAMYPNVMISTLNPAWSLTIHNASSSPYTLKVMTIVACTMVPVVLLYQGWTYWIFRKRLTGATKLEY